MGLLDKLKKKMKKQENENNQGGTSHTGDRTRNKVRDDNRFGDKQAENEGAGGSPKTPREKNKRNNFR
jgi:hypothetical protein